MTIFFQNNISPQFWGLIVSANIYTEGRIGEVGLVTKNDVN